MRLVTFATSDESDEETWPDQKRPTYIPTHLPTYLPPLENNLKERSQRLVAFDTFDQSDDETCSDQQFYNFDHFWQFWQLWQLWQFWQQKDSSSNKMTFETLISILTMEKLNSWKSFWPDNTQSNYTKLGTILSSNGQLRVTLDSICNSWDVLKSTSRLSLLRIKYFPVHRK